MKRICALIPHCREISCNLKFVKSLVSPLRKAVKNFLDGNPSKNTIKNGEKVSKPRANIKRKLGHCIKDYFEGFLKEWIRSFAKIILNFLGGIIIVMCIINPIILRPFKYQINLQKLLESYGVEGLQKEPEKIKAPIKEIKKPVILTQEYPSSQGYTYQQSINLLTDSAVMTWQEKGQPFWFGIANLQAKENYRNPTLILKFAGKVNVRVDSKDSRGWVEYDPNFTYFIRLKEDLQPLMTYTLNPLLVRFPEEGEYQVHFEIRGDNEIPVGGDFLIKVGK